MTIRTINGKEAHTLLTADVAALLLDIHPGEYFAEQHLPGACNACVYEVTFLEQVRAITTDLDRPIIIYGFSSRSLASEKAVEKLAEAGYRNLYNIAGGLAEWEAAGLPLERNPDQAVPVPRFREGCYTIDTEKSLLHWVGRSIVSRHYGTIGLGAGELCLEGGTIVSGQLTVAMDTIANIDLTDSDWNSLLISHLKSEDFFHVARFPTASLTIAEAVALPDASPGTPNFQITGALTIKGISNPVTFPALIAPRDGGGLNAQAHFDIDRTRWQVQYGSGRLFEKLGMHLVNDIITLELQVTAS
jgi:polyisoprenoid-binding protein YceI/rhodanese-related sulfurtransferase